MKSPDRLFVGRDSPQEKLRSFIAGNLTSKKVRILPVSGPGGIGKTYLLDHVLATSNYKSRAYLEVRIHGSDNPGPIGSLGTDDWMKGSTGVDISQSQVYRRIKRCQSALSQIDAAAKSELLEAAADKDEVKAVLQKAFKVGRGIQEVIPALDKYVNLKKVKDETVADAVDLARRAKAFGREREFIAWAVGKERGAGLRNRLRSNLSQTLAECLVADVSDIINRQKEGIERLLLIVDDYEGLQSRIERFLVDDLIPRLEGASIETDLVVLGRDALADTHPAWRQNMDGYMLQDVKLQPFSDAEARSFCMQSGLSDSKAIDRIIDETKGFPFLLASEVEDELAGGRSALGLKSFFDRTTRWMNPGQRDWLKALVFLDIVNRETIPSVLPESDSNEVLEWFKNEASIRDTTAKVWVVRPIIGSRIQEYVAVDSPVVAQQLKDKAAKRSG